MASKPQTSSFDFDAYNALMTTANSGLRLFLAERMLQDVLAVMARYRSPLLEDITQIVDGVEELRENNKKYLASRQSKTDEYKRVVVDDNRGPDDAALTPPAHSTSADAGKVA